MHFVEFDIYWHNFDVVIQIQLPSKSVLRSHILLLSFKSYLESRLSYPSVWLFAWLANLHSTASNKHCWWEKLDTRLKAQAQVKEQHNRFQLQPVPSFRSYTRTPTRTISPPPLLSNVGTSSETPLLNSSTVLLSIKHCYSMQLFAV